MKIVRSIARVRVTIEIQNLGPWGPNATAEQIYMQARDGAFARLRQDLGGFKIGDFRIVGEPEVVMVTTEEETPR